MKLHTAKVKQQIDLTLVIEQDGKLRVENAPEWLNIWAAKEDGNITITIRGQEHADAVSTTTFDFNSGNGT